MHRSQGLFDVGKIKAGDTLLVSGAAGATGSVVCQLGKIAGAKVIALAGTPEKCEWLEREVGVDKAVNYKSPNFRQEFKDAVGYIDVYFDNVGGEILDMALLRLKKNARIVLCGELLHLCILWRCFCGAWADHLMNRWDFRI